MTEPASPLLPVKPERPKLVPLTAVVTESQRAAIDRLADTTNHSVSEVVRALIDRALDSE